MPITLTDLDLGTVPGDGTGDDARTGGTSINTNNATLEAAVADKADAETIAGLWDFQGDLKTDAISESTGAAGITLNHSTISAVTDTGLFKSATNQALVLAGGTGASSGANLWLYGPAHGSKFNDITFRTDASTKLEFDSSGSVWDFKSNAITTTGIITGLQAKLTTATNSINRNASNSLLTVCGGQTVADGGSIQLYGGSHATQADDIEFLANGAVELQYDDNLSKWDFKANEITTSGDIVFPEKADHTSTPGAGFGYLWVKNTAPTTLIFTDDDGTDFTLGSGGGGAFTADAQTQITPTTAIVLDEATGDEDALDLSFTVNKATSGNYRGIFMDVTETAAPGGASQLIDIRVNGSNRFFLTDSGSLRIGSDGSGTITSIVKNTNAGKLIYCGGSATTSGANLVMYGGTTVGQANDFEFRSGTTVKLWYDDSADTWDFKANKLIANPVLDDATGDEVALDIPLTVNKATSGNYTGLRIAATETAAPGTDDRLVSCTVGGADRFLVTNDGSLGVGSTVTATESSIYRNVGDGTFVLSGGTGAASGGIIKMYGATHGTQAKDIEFYSDSTLELQFDESANRWNFQTAGIWTGGAVRAGSVQITQEGGVTRNVTASSLILSGGKHTRHTS
jgi:hypothetical protein